MVLQFFKQQMRRMVRLVLELDQVRMSSSEKILWPLYCFGVFLLIFYMFLVCSLLIVTIIIYQQVLLFFVFILILTKMVTAFKVIITTL